MVSDQGIRTGYSTKTDAAEAVDEIWEQVHQEDSKLVAFFCSYSYDFDKLASRVRDRFGIANVIGCTTGGEIGPGGYISQSVSAFSLAGPDFEVETGCIRDLAGFSPPEGRSLVRNLLVGLSSKGVQPAKDNTFGVQIMNHIAGREEIVTHALSHAMDDIPLVGGSAGDDMRHETPYIYVDGAFRSNCSLLNMIWTARQFEVISTHNFTEGNVRLVITAADTAQRLVTEINGEPAAQEYSDAIGLRIEDLTDTVFAAHPVLLTVRGQLYARAIQRVNDDGSILFGSAIGQGVVLNVGSATSIADNLSRAFESVRGKMGEPSLTIAFDCSLRRLDVLATNCIDAVSDIIKSNRVVGFCTYGEQIGPLAVQQTFVGVAIGRRCDDRLE